MLIATGLGTRRSTNWMRLEERTPAASRLVHFDLASQPMKHVNVHAVHELDQFSRKCLPKDVSASGGTTPWRAFQPEPEAGDLPFPTTRRGWVAGATEHEPSGAPSRHTPGGRLSAVGGESDAAGAGAELRGRDLAVVDGVDDDRVGDQWAKLLSGRPQRHPPRK